MKRKIRGSFDTIVAEPFMGKELEGELAQYRSVRIGRFRVVYRIVAHEIQVAAVGARATVYADLTERIRQERQP